MTDLLKGLTGGSWALLFAWVFPSALALGAFWTLIYPVLSHIPLTEVLGTAKSDSQSAGATRGSLSFVDRTLILAVLSFALGILLNAASTPLYRFLEGYSWPSCLREWGVRTQKARKNRLNVSTSAGWARGLILERLARYPLDDDQIGPTKLANALRAFETYGKTRFNLDSQTLWSELLSVAPTYLQNEIDRSRANVDFFVAMVYLSGVFGIISLVGFILRIGEWQLALYAAVAFVLTKVWYEMAVVSSSYWSATVQSLVNIGRKPLAEAMSLRLPSTLEDERVMWGLVTRLTFYGHGAVDEQRLDRFRDGALRARPRSRP